MNNMLVNTKLMYFRYTGASTLTLNSTNAPWINKVVKITKLSARNTTTGLNTRQTFAGSYNGASAGGAMTTLEPGEGYELTAGLYNGSWSVPNAIKILDILPDATRLLFTVPANQSNVSTSPVTIAAGDAGSYLLESATGLTVTNFYVNDLVTIVPNTDFPIALAGGDAVGFDFSTTGTPGTLTLIKV
jgi:hypothetical protein